MIKVSSNVFWVVALNTNAGKTSLASALIRVLNEKGIPALGFKPIVGMRYSEGVDNFHLYDSRKCGLHGSDATKLCYASPITQDVMPSVIAPNQLLFRNNIKEPLLTRMGSPQLGNLTYYKGSYLDDFIKIPKIKDTLQKSVPIENLADWLMPEEQRPVEFIASALNFLESLGPEEIVMEGAGPLLPSFKGVNHAKNILLIQGNRITFFENIDIQIHIKHEKLIHIEQILPKLHSHARNPVTVELKKVNPSMLEVYYDHLVRQLLTNYKNASLT